MFLPLKQFPLPAGDFLISFFFRTAVPDGIRTQVSLFFYFSYIICFRLLFISFFFPDILILDIIFPQISSLPLPMSAISGL